ncbi:hypothetical protein SSM2_157 [Synechococcus phage S-SM2]|uniref:Uncharacterized protein n=1 Tax=Synechococcus phage S-SM2 TaxID=444860 RepID=E3SJ51_9CAUD|nr:hypothetical protein SSM2_157 [Synechococcus phage S-SM2]ADO97499.1 hypothetical protein SSM2_157 [Synechococcus phage S-SM2]
MPTLNKKKIAVTVDQLRQKYPSFDEEFNKSWRRIVRRALSDQVARNPNSSCLRGIKEIVRNHFSFLFDDDELNKIVDMISTRFNKRKLSTEWDDWRDSLPKIFPEKSVGKLSWFEDGDGVPESVSMIEEKETKIKEGCAVIIIQDGNFKSEYTNVPSDVALTINAELSKALS